MENLRKYTEIPHPLFFPDGSAGVPPHGGPRRRLRHRAEQDGRVAHGREPADHDDRRRPVLGCK